VKLPLIALLTFPLVAQESLWRDQNPYVAPPREGEIIAIEVNESFQLVNDGQWNTSQRYETKLVPDTKNIPFLTTSQQNKSNSKASTNSSKFRDSYRFRITGTLGPKQADGNFPLTAQKNLTIDGRPVRISLSGLVDPRRIRQGSIESRHVGNLTMNVESEPPFPKDQKLNLKPPAGTDPNSKPTMTDFSDQLRKELLIEHMKQILGGLTQ